MNLSLVVSELPPRFNTRSAVIRLVYSLLLLMSTAGLSDVKFFSGVKATRAGLLIVCWRQLVWKIGKSVKTVRRETRGMYMENSKTRKRKKKKGSQDSNMRSGY